MPNENETENPETPAHLSWRAEIARFERPSRARSLLDLATSVAPYLALVVAAYLVFDVSVWLTLGLSVLASGFLLRTFIVFHDCGHGSFFASKRANRLVGRVTAFLTFQAFADWRFKHAIHHGSAGDLDRRGTGDVHTLTLDEYLERPWRGRLAYRLFRSPFVMFTLGPIWSLIIGPRLVSAGMRRRQLNSVLLTNAGLALVHGVLIWQFGIGVWAAALMPAAMIAGTAGVWLFYVQHQFEDVYWESGSRWSYAEAALRGSSHLRLPAVLRFFTGNIGLHHVHHLSAKVPNYNLVAADSELEIFADVPVLTMIDGIKAMRLKLIDAESGSLLTWADVRARRSASPATSVASL